MFCRANSNIAVMPETVYGESPIRCRECGKELETIEEVHLQSQNCTGELDDVEEYRDKYGKAPTRTREMRDKISERLSSE